MQIATNNSSHITDSSAQLFTLMVVGAESEFKFFSDFIEYSL